MQKSISIVLILAVSVLIVYSQVGCNGEKGEHQRGGEIVASEPQIKTAEVSIEPIWEGIKGMQIADQRFDSQDFHLFWDRSIPMGGYIHRTERDSQFTLQRIHEVFFDAHYLTDDYRGGEITCKGVSDIILTFDCDSRLSREFFNGGDSRLGKVIEDVTESLLNGNLKSAALVTDLTATTGNVSGAHTLLPYFDPLRTYFNEGMIHAAVLGIRMDYWGVHAGACRTVRGSLGCWYHEGEKIYKRLRQVVKRPIYVLIMGVNLDQDTSDDNSVSKIAHELQRLVVESGGDVKSEVITLGALGHQTDLDWNSLDGYRGTPPIELDIERGYSCNDRKIFDLNAKFSEGAISIDENSIEKFDSLNTFTRLRKDGENGISLRLDCESVSDQIRQDRQRDEGDKICNDRGMVKSIFSLVTAKISYEGSSFTDWSAWSSVSHRADATLFLSNFIQGLRPSYYLASISPFPPLDCSS